MKKHLILSLLLFVSIVFFSSLRAQDNNNTPPTWKIDHVVIVVNNLSLATRDFIQLGFNVVPGNSKNGIVQTALIPFFDGTYIELFSPLNSLSISELQKLKQQNKLTGLTDNLNALDARFVDRIADGEGFADFAMSQPDVDLNEEIMDLHDQSTLYVGPIPISEKEVYGYRVDQEVAVPEAGYLPLLITRSASYSPLSGVKHSLLQRNWVSGIASITIAVDDIDTASQNYQTLLGSKPVANPSFINPPSNVKIVVFKSGNIYIILAQPTDLKSPLNRYLISHGSGIYRIKLYTTDKYFARKLDPALSHHAEIKLIYK